MSSEIASAYVTIRAATDKLASDLASARSMATGFVQSVGSILSGGLTAALGGFAGAGLVKMFADAEMGAMRFNAVWQNMGASLGYTREQLGFISQEIQGMSVFSAATVRESMIHLMKFNEVRGENFRDVMKAAANMAALTGGSLEHTVEMIGRALQTPSIAYGTLHRAGAPFTIAEVNALHGTKDATQQRAIIMGMLSRTSTGLAEAQRNTLSGQFQLMVNQAKLVGIELGQALAPALKAVLPALESMLATVKQNREVFTQLGLSVASIVNRAVSGFSAVVKWLGNLSPETKKWIGDLIAVGGAIGVAWVAGRQLLGVTSLIGMAWGALTSPVMLIGAAIATLAGVDIGKVFIDPMGAIRSLFDTVQGFLAANKERFDEWGQVIGSIARSVWEGVTTIAGKALQYIGDLFGWLVGSNKLSWNSIADSITEALYYLMDVVQNFGAFYDRVINGLAQKLAAWYDKLAARPKMNVSGTLGEEIQNTQERVKQLKEEAKVNPFFNAHKQLKEMEEHLHKLQLLQHAIATRKMSPEVAAEETKKALSVYGTQSAEARIVEDQKRAEAEMRERMKKAKQKFLEDRDKAKTPTPEKPPPTPDMTPHPEGGPISSIPFKFGTTQFENLGMEIQKSLTGGSMLDIAKRHADLTAESLKKLDGIKNAILKKEPPPAVT